MSEVDPFELADAVIRLLREDDDLRRAEVEYDPDSVDYVDGELTIGLFVYCEENIARPKYEEGEVDYEVVCIWRDTGSASSVSEARREIEDIEWVQANDLCEAAVDILDGEVIEVNGREFALTVESAEPSLASDGIRCVLELSLSEE